MSSCVQESRMYKGARKNHVWEKNLAPSKVMEFQPGVSVSSCGQQKALATSQTAWQGASSKAVRVRMNAHKCLMSLPVSMQARCIFLEPTSNDNSERAKLSKPAADPHYYILVRRDCCPCCSSSLIHVPPPFLMGPCG